MKTTTTRLVLPLAALTLIAALDAGAKGPPAGDRPGPGTMAEFYVKNGWGVFPYPTITKLGAMGGRAAPVPYPQLSMKQPLDNMICRTDHGDRGQSTWQVGTQWGANCIYAWEGKQDQNGPERSHVLMVDPAFAGRFEFQPVAFKTIPSGKAGTLRISVVSNAPLLPFGSGYDFSKAADTGTVTGGKYIYHVCRVLHRPGLWHYGKVRENETQCMFAGNAKGLGVTSGYQVLVMN